MKYASNRVLLKMFSVVPRREYGELSEKLIFSRKSADPSALVYAVLGKAKNAYLRPFQDAEPFGYAEVIFDLMETLGAQKGASSEKLRSVRKLLRSDEIGEFAKDDPFADDLVDLLEQDLLEFVGRRIYESLHPKKKRELETRLRKLADEERKNPFGHALTIGSALAAGNVAGFGAYTALSSLLSFVSAGTLGFGAYTAASSALSLVLGPVGWTALGVYTIHQFGKADPKELLPIVVGIAVLRQKHRNAVNPDQKCRASILRSLWGPEGKEIFRRENESRPLRKPTYEEGDVWFED